MRWLSVMFLAAGLLAADGVRDPLWRSGLGEMVESSPIIALAAVQADPALPEGAPPEKLVCRVVIDRWKPIRDELNWTTRVPAVTWDIPRPGPTEPRFPFVQFTVNGGTTVCGLWMLKAINESGVVSSPAAGTPLANDWPVGYLVVDPALEGRITSEIRAFLTLMDDINAGRKPNPWTAPEARRNLLIDPDRWHALWVADLGMRRTKDIPDEAIATIGDRRFGRRWRGAMLARVAEAARSPAWDGLRRRAFADRAITWFEQVDTCDCDIRLATFRMIVEWAQDGLVTWRAVKPWVRLGLQDDLFTRGYFGSPNDRADDGGEAIPVADHRSAMVSIRRTGVPFLQKMVDDRVGDAAEQPGALRGGQ